MLDQILSIFNSNVSRVENLISLYGPPRRGRRAVKDTDILRAALVLLHASLEDLLRSILIWRVPAGTAEEINKYPLTGSQNKRAEKFSLGDLTAFRGMTVDDVIKKSVVEHLDRWSSFNDLGEVMKALKSAGLDTAVVNVHNFGNLPAMISRRHHIVHKADRNDVQQGQGNHQTKPISVANLNSYLQAVKDLGALVDQHLR